MSYKEKIFMLLERFEEGRLKEVYNVLVYLYLRGAS